MPKIYEYLGILIFFYSNEHEPVHVHGKYGSQEIKAEIIIVDGKIEEIRITNIKNRKPLEGNKRKYFIDFVEIYANQIVQKWVDYFVYHKDIKFERINKKLK
jgi:hypothetical protein